MASGSEPPHIRDLFTYIAPLCCGYSLAGAGGGGYAVVILTDKVSRYMLQDRVDRYIKDCGLDIVMTVHGVTVNGTGIRVEYADQATDLF